MFSIKTPRPNLYDYIKVIAILTMIVDHMGFFLYPEISELRIIGRIAFPLFLFLVGYNGSYRFSRSLFGLAFILQSVITGVYYLDLSNIGLVGNILRGIIAARILCHGLQYLLQKTKNQTLTIILVLLGILGSYALYDTSITVVDYGTLSFVFALIGFASSQLRDYKYLSMIIILVTSLIHIHFMSYFLYDRFDVIMMSVFMLFNSTLFLLITYKNYTLKWRPLRNTSILFVSHHALHIYGIHIVILMIIGYITSL